MKNYLIIALVSVMTVFAVTSCKDQPNAFELSDGVPTIKYIRPQNVDQKDSLLVEASLGSSITIVGENLTSIKELYFNDKKAVLNTSYITYNTMLVTIPNAIPKNITDKIMMVTKNDEKVTYPFHIVVPSPIASAMKNEYAAEGSIGVITGLYFDNNAADPLKVYFMGTGSTEPLQAEVKSVTDNEIQFVVPAGAPAGRIKVHTIFGESLSHFMYKDNRGIITDFDGAESGANFLNSTSGVLPQGWNIAAQYATEFEGIPGVSGRFVIMGDGATELTGDAWAEQFKLPFWCGNWNGDPMSITKEEVGVPLRNTQEKGYYADPSSMSFKFEICIPKNNPWSAAAMQILFVNNQQCANDSWQNNTYIHTSANGGLDLCRGLWIPWQATGSFDTNDEWITVTIPISDFIYNADGTKGSVRISEESFDSFVIWPWNGGAMGTLCTPIFLMDNFRVVPNL